MTIVSTAISYIFASLAALETRLRIKTDNQDKTEFSRQFPINCGIYTEGCEGGYPILVGKFFNEFEILPEQCWKDYTEKTGSCSGYCNIEENKKIYRVNNYGYIGGYYGNTTEEDMIKELRARGPILGNVRNE
jgi:cathepsin C